MQGPKAAEDHRCGDVSGSPSRCEVQLAGALVPEGERCAVASNESGLCIAEKERAALIFNKYFYLTTGGTSTTA